MRTYRAQKAALTRAVNSGKPERVVTEVRRAIAEWNGPGGYWPDDWADWHRALQDATGKPEVI